MIHPSRPMDVAPFASAPRDARVFPLKADSKEPLRGSVAHHDARPLDEITEVAVNLGWTNRYGIALDGQFVLVDFDREDTDGWLARLPETWQQKTRRGQHLLYRIPPGTDVTRLAYAAFAGGDVKVRGYLVGPGTTVKGHTYTRIETPSGLLEPVYAPEWLLDYVTAKTRAHGQEGLENDAPERDAIVDGERDNELTKFAGFLRARGFSRAAIEAALTGIVSSGLVEQPPGREIEPRDVRRIAGSIARKEAGMPTDIDPGAIMPFGWVGGDELRLVGPPIRWWVYGFVPRAELVTIYGMGGIGKSTLGRWMAAKVTRAGGLFVPLLVEESARRFVLGAVMQGADRSRIILPGDPGRITFPTTAERFIAEVEGLGDPTNTVVWVDAIYSHMAAGQGLNAAERARLALGPLAYAVQRSGITCVCVFHENKTGVYLGSVEMVNVARTVLRVRRASPDAPLRVGVDKTNLVNPGVDLEFTSREVEAADGGLVQMQENEAGELVPLTLRVLDEPTRVEVQDLEATSGLTEIALDTIAEPKVRKKALRVIEGGGGAPPSVEGGTP